MKIFEPMTEAEGRARIVVEAKSWIGTPYVDGAMVKGAGCDCGRGLMGIYVNAGAIDEFDPGYYAPQHHMHSNEEVYLRYVLQHAHEINGPPLPGDVVMFKLGRVFSHGAVVIGWPRIVHTMRLEGTVIENVERCVIGPRALSKLPRKYFSLWGEK